MKHIKLIIFGTIFLLYSSVTQAQSVMISTGTDAADASSILEIKATGKGLLIPRMGLGDRPSSPATGLLIYQTDNTPGFYYYDGSGWIKFGDIGDYSAENGITLASNTFKLGGALTGNTEITQGDAETLTFTNGGTGNFTVNLSSTGGFDIQDNGTSALFVKDNGNVGIGENNPAYKFSLVGNGAISGQDNFFYFANNNGLGPTRPIISNTGAAIGWNYTNGFGEMDIWNCYTTANVPGVNGGFTFKQMTAAAAHTDLMRIQSDGKVGIGTMSPDALLEIASTSAAGMIINAGTNENSYLDFQENGSLTSNIWWQGEDDGGGYSEYFGINEGDEWTSAVNTVINRDDGNVGIGTANPNDKLDVIGNAQVSGYLRVGDPTEVSGSNNDDQILYHIDFNSTDYWNLIGLYCNTGSGLWSVQSDGIKFDNDGTSNHYRVLYSPYIWLPANINSGDLRVELLHECDLENGFDGVYIEYTKDLGSTITKITSWSSNGYTAGVDGCSTGCVDAETDAWTSGSFVGKVTSVSDDIITEYPQGTWIRFGLVGMENEDTGDGDYELDEFWLYGDNITYGNYGSSGFSEGDIYAEGHVYASSSNQIGDVAEYFPVKGETKPGDLISMDSKGSNQCYVSSKKMDAMVIGVHSTAPSVLVNDPKEGIPVGLTGRVPVNFSNENGEIKAGDYLTASSKKGYAMKATEPCFVVGRAIQTLSSENNQVMCMLGTGWYNPNPHSEGVVSGKSKILSGNKTLRIFDDRITQYSRVFVTMRDDPGSYFWVNNVSDGSFEISLGKESTKNINFDYLVNNASTQNEIIETINNKILAVENKDATKTEKDNNSKPCKNCPVSYSYIGNKKGINVSQISFSDNPPSPPPDVNKAWTWDPVNGFKEQSSTSKNQKIEKK